jgi:hypothetical protein
MIQVQQNRLKWIELLETTDEQYHCTGYFSTWDNKDGIDKSYCPIGLVANHFFYEPENQTWLEMAEEAYDSSKVYETFIINTFGEKDDNTWSILSLMKSIIDLNDTREWTFVEIADWLRSYWKIYKEDSI